MLLMTAVSAVLAVVGLKVLRVVLASDVASPGDELMRAFTSALRVISGSFLLGLACGFALDRLSPLVRGTPAMPVLQIALVIVASMVAAQWTLSPLLALLVAGMTARVRMRHGLTVEPHLGSAGAVLNVLLFICLGLLFTLDGLWTAWPMVLAIIVARLAGAGLAIGALARASGLGWQQAAGLVLALQPMSSLAVLLAADTFGWGSQLPGMHEPTLQALLVAITLMQLTGPLWTQLSLRHLARETEASLTMPLQDFTSSQALTLGVELELQLVSTHDFDLSPQAEDLLRVLKSHTGAWDVKPEITRSMIEIGTSIQRQHQSLLAELHDLRDQLSRGARKLNIGIAGGGTHAYQHWSRQQIFPGERFHYISELYGYLAKQFTVFGQHVHVGCEDGDQALWLLHALSRYVPHFIALSASSPYVQGVDTGFDSARLNSVFAFPLVGPRALLPGLGRVRQLLRQDDQHRRGQVDEGLLLGHPPQARVRHDRAARVRHAAHGGEGGGTGLLPAMHLPLPARAPAVRAGRGRLPRLHLQPLPGLPLRPGRRDRRPEDQGAHELRDDILRTLSRVDEHALDLQALDASNLIRESLFDGNDARWLRGDTARACRCRRWWRPPRGAGWARPSAGGVRPSARSAGSGEAAPWCRRPSSGHPAVRRHATFLRSRSRTCGTARSPDGCRRRR